MLNLYRFLFARFALDHLKELQTDDQVQQTLHNLPRSLWDHYREAMAKLEKASQQSESRKLFLWILYSRRPLLVEEFVEVMRLATNQDAASLTNDNASEIYKSVQQLSNGLAQITPYSDHLVVGLVHYSARDFLLMSNGDEWWHIDPVEGQETILRRCLEALTDEATVSSSTSSPTEFSKYAATQWPFHWQRLVAENKYNVPGDISDLFHRLFDPQTPRYSSAWLELRRSLDPNEGFKEPPVDCLSMATYVGTLQIPVSLDPTQESSK